MGVVRYRAWAEMRGRWRGLLVLALLVGLAGGAVLTALAGARRSSTAYERFHEQTLAADLSVTTSISERLDTVAALPEVEAMALHSYPFIIPAGSDLYPYLEFLAVASADGKLGTVIDIPRLVEGRLPDPDRIDEVAVTARFAAEAGLAVGDRAAFESYAPEQLDALFGSGNAGEPAGPVVDLTVTGVVDLPELLGDSQSGFVAQVMLPTAFHREYRDRIAAYEHRPSTVASIRLRSSDAEDVAAVASAVRQIYADDPDLEITLATEVEERIDDSVRVLVVALWLFAAAAGAAGVAAVGQAFTRHLSESRSDQQRLAALGMARRHRVASLAASVLPVAAGGALLAVVAAVAASPLMPIGLARRAEPDLGVSVDRTVLALGFVGTATVVVGLAVLAAWGTSRAASSAERRLRDGELSGVRRALAAVELPPTVVTGVRIALAPDRGRGAAIPVRSALASVATGTAGLVAVVVFAASLAALVATPSWYGFPWDASVAGFSPALVDEHRDELVADPTISDLSIGTISVVHIEGNDLNVHVVERLTGSAEPTLLEGRLPERADEVVLGSRTLRGAGADLGDTVEMTGPGGAFRFRVVGRGAFPIADERSAVGRGALVTHDGLAQLAASEVFAHDFLVTWAAGVDEVAANLGLAALTGAEVFPPRLPPDVRNLQLVETVPWALAAFLAVLAAAALVHVLVSTVGRRRHDLAVLRSLGFVGAQVSAVLAWQAASFAVVGLLAGIPLGVIAGRITWSLVASSIGTADHPVTPWAGLGIVALAALLTATLVATVPGRMARAIRPADALRTE